MKKVLRYWKMTVVVVALLLAGRGLVAVVHADASSAASPVIALTEVPLLGEQKEYISGQVFFENGQEVVSENYRVALYVQSREGDGQYYIKPTYEDCFYALADDASFTGKFVSHENDYTAEVLHIFLIPGDYTPTEGFEKTREKAFDYVTVTRKKTNVIAPAREVPENLPQVFPTRVLPVSGEKIGIDVGFYTEIGSRPGSELTEKHIGECLDKLSPFTDTVRFYASGGQLTKAYRLAKERGFKVVGNAWISKDEHENEEELKALIENCKEGLVDVAVVGSEALEAKLVTPGKLVEYLKYARENIDPEIPVTTADTLDQLLANKEVRLACDILMPNLYPCFGGAAGDQALVSFEQSYYRLKALGGNKQIVVSETGHPTAGNELPYGVTAGEAEAARYFQELRQWSLTNEVSVLWFEAFDEDFKYYDTNKEIERHFGIFDGNLVMKDAYASTEFFKSFAAPSFRTNSLLLSGEIGVNFYMDLPEIEGVDYTKSYMVFTVSGKTREVPFDPNAKNRDETLYQFTCHVNAAQMAETIDAVFHYAVDGEEREISSRCSVKDYIEAYTALEEPDEKTLVLVKALADYGHYAQQYLANVNGWTIGEKYAEMDLHYTDGYGADLHAIAEALSTQKAELKKTNDIGKVSISLNLDSGTMICLYVQPANGYKGDFTAQVDGLPADAKLLSDGRYRVSITGIAAHLLGKTYTIKVLTNAGENVVSLSAMTYILLSLTNPSSPEEETNAMAALYKYYAAADAAPKNKTFRNKTKNRTYVFAINS